MIVVKEKIMNMLKKKNVVMVKTKINATNMQTKKTVRKNKDVVIEEGRVCI
ncbi:MAG TPA: hypothetical protein HA277_00705 [Methanosphaera sp.]|nr:hypothetical protein [Methanosphaera sp.]HIJ14910.1 hypothetical protein [Methanosphaera sp.]